ncbi:MAG TPA: FIST N-terminal domain-containing protein [Acidimicrobiales bacterium]|nr:FIST N-terminal domain-containing protein [Acidimicrobiales bacterium]
MPFAAALSEHPVAAHAVGEVAGHVLDTIGAGLDLALVFVTRQHSGALDDAARAVRDLLDARVIVGAVTESIVGRSWEVEETAGISVFAARLAGGVAPLSLSATLDGVVGLPEDLGVEPSAVALFADPSSVAAGSLLEAVATRWPGVPVFGGFASGGSAPGGSRLLVGDHIRRDGCVGVAFGAGVAIDVVLSQGCRPVGAPFVITAATGNRITGLGGRPPLERIDHLADTELSEDDIAAVNSGGLRVGFVVDEHEPDHRPGDFVIRPVLGGNRATGWIAVEGEVDVGQTVQLHVHSAASADDDLRRVLAGRDASAALLFPTRNRGRRLFGERHHDASVLDDEAAPAAVSGFFSAGTFAPVHGRSFVHGEAVSIALLSDANSDDARAGAG